MAEHELAGLARFDYRMLVRALTNLLLLPAVIASLAVPGVVRAGWQPAMVFAAIAVLINVFLVMRFREVNVGATVAMTLLGWAAISASSLALSAPATSQACLGLLALAATNAAITFPTRIVMLCTAACLGLGAAVIVLRAPSTADGVGTLWIFALILIVPTATVVRLRHLLSQAVQSAEERASVDPLTGLLNRRGIQDAFVAMVYDDVGTQDVAVLMIDVDSFKSFNDRYGHAEGDKLLRALADAIRSAASPPALVARIGGDEFVVVVRAEVQHAELEAEKIRRTVASSTSHEGVTVSIGATSSPIDQAVLDRLIDMADHLMYRAKAAGGNTIFASPDRRHSGSQADAPPR